MSEHDPLQQLWTQQKQEPLTMSLTEIHARAERFQARIRWRNWIEYGAAALGGIAFIAIAIETPDWGVRTGAALIVAGLVYVVWKLATVAGVARKDEGQSWAEFHRAELERQRAAHSSVWRWYLGPFAPGMIVFIGAIAFSPSADLPLLARLAVALSALGVVAAVFCGIAWLNAQAAKRIEVEIAALDRACSG